MRRASRFLVVLLLMLAMLALGWIAGKTRMGSSVDRASMSELERQFADRMRGVALVGYFTVAGREDRGTRPDRYEISSVEKVGDAEWRFNARMEDSGLDVTLPIVVDMLWAGDTPMITMTEASIPTLGTFTVRVFFYGDRYAGTWQHGPVGGHMYGRVEKTGIGD
jgi:hypothetical protein